jgi:hypothetical protein
MLIVPAPASITAATTSARKSSSVARGVLRRELDVIAQAAGQLHALDGLAQDLLLGHLQLVFAMDRAGGEEHVDAAALAPAGPPARRARCIAGCSAPARR